MTALKSICAVSITAIALMGCTDPSRFDPNAPDRNNTQAGAIIGGLAGAINGINSSSRDDRTKGAIIGGVIGAGAGALIGQQLDQQEEDLRRDLGNDQVKIVNTGSELVVTMPQDILFAIDSATVRSDLRRDLGALAGNLQAHPNTTVQIIGHTDNTGSAAYNLALSERRSQSVANVLIENGVNANRLNAIGRGEDAPVATNLTEEGRAQNRRVDIIITPNV